jgi:hypothetical protein
VEEADFKDNCRRSSHRDCNRIDSGRVERPGSVAEPTSSGGGRGGVCRDFAKVTIYPLNLDSSFICVPRYPGDDVYGRLQS